MHLFKNFVPIKETACNKFVNWNCKFVQQFYRISTDFAQIYRSTKKFLVTVPDFLSIP